MHGDQFGEFLCGYCGLKVLPVGTFHSSFKQLATSKLPKASVSKRG